MQFKLLLLWKLIVKSSFIVNSCPIKRGVVKHMQSYTHLPFADKFCLYSAVLALKYSHLTKTFTSRQVMLYSNII